jgi:hypothetical protein
MSLIEKLNKARRMPLAQVYAVLAYKAGVYAARARRKAYRALAEA